MYGVTHVRCKKRWGMDGLTAAFEYRGVVSRLIQKIKYKRVEEIYEVVVEMVVSLGEFTVLERGSWLVVGVPLHRRRVRERGFNQAELLARALAESFGWEHVEGVLVRRRYTKPQVKLEKSERLENVRGAFKIGGREAERLVRGRGVVLVDDVWTTGATMRECAKVLKRCGAGEVWGLVVAS